MDKYEVVKDIEDILDSAVTFLKTDDFEYVIKMVESMVREYK